MKAERLVIFCSDAASDVEKVRGLLRLALAPFHLAGADLHPEKGPIGLADAGWRTWSLTLPSGLAALRDRLDRLAESFCKGLSEDVLCIYVEPTHSRARACLQSPSGFPRSSEGDTFHVLRQAANWVDADPVQLLRFFSGSDSSGPRTSSSLTSSGGLAVDEPHSRAAEPDEDDRFVEAKLKFARELMQQYLANRKPD